MVGSADAKQRERSREVGKGAQSMKGTPGPGKDTKGQQRLLAMQCNDNSWIRGLIGRPELNGRHVLLHEWKQDEQRWRCKPVGWSFEHEFVSVRARNLHNEPPPKTAPKGSAPSAGTAVELMKLVEREGLLRSAAHLSPAARLKHLLCQQALLKVQMDILSHRENKALFMQAREMLQTHEKDLAPVLARWEASGCEAVDFWVDEE